MNKSVLPPLLRYVLRPIWRYNKSKLLLFLGLLSLTPYFLLGTKTDSLLVALRGTLSLEEKLEVYAQLAYEYAETDSAKTYLYATQAVALAEELNKPEVICDAYYQMSWINIKLGNFEEAELLLHEMEKRAANIQYLKGVANANNGIAVIYSRYGNYEEVLDRYLEVLETRTQLGDSAGMAAAYNNLGSVYYDLDKYEEGIRAFQQSVAIKRDLGNFKGVVASFQGIGATYLLLAEYDSALRYLQEALTLNEALENVGPSFYIYKSLAELYKVQGKMQVAEKYYKHALDITRELGHRFEEKTAIARLGGFYKVQGRFTEALKCYTEAIEIAEEIGIPTGPDYGSIAGIYEEKEDWKSALDYRQASYKKSKEVNDRYVEGHALLGIGRSYQYMQRIDTAFALYQQALSIFTDLGTKDLLGVCYRHLASNLHERGKYAEAIKLYEKSFSISKELGEVQEMAITLTSLGAIYLDLKTPALAKKYAYEGLTQAQSAGLQREIREGARVAYKIEKALGNFEEALAAHELYFHVYDTLLGEKKEQELSELQVVFETERKEATIKKLNQEATIQQLELDQASLRLTILGVVLVTLLLAALLVYNIGRQKRVRLTHRAREMEQKLLRTQMDPHFIFNAMTAIQHYMRKGGTQQAADYLAQFSKLIRQVLNSSRSDFISLKQEISMLEYYLNLQNLRRNKPFTYEITLLGDLHSDEFYIPPMFAQPFIENAIEHGFANMTGEGQIFISFKLAEDHLILQIQDNGSGRNPVKKKDSEHTSHAIQITRERIALYKQNSKKEIGFLIEDLTPGTRVSLSLPYN